MTCYVTNLDHEMYACKLTRSKTCRNTTFTLLQHALPSTKTPGALAAGGACHQPLPRCRNGGGPNDFQVGCAPYSGQENALAVRNQGFLFQICFYPSWAVPVAGIWGLNACSLVPIKGREWRKTAFWPQSDPPLASNWSCQCL